MLTAITMQNGNLRLAIAQLYHVFQRYKVGQIIETDGYPIDSGPLLGPLRRLTAADLERYRWKAMTTYGTVEQFKHFLPRLCELYAIDRESKNEWDCEMLGAKLNYGHWVKWPQKERDSVRVFLHAWWNAALDSAAESDTCSPDMGDFVCCIGQAEDDLSPYLDEWIDPPGEIRLMHLAGFINGQISELMQGKLDDAFWFERHAQMRQVADWLAEARIGDLLDKFYLAQAEKPESKAIAAASDALAAIRRVRQANSAQSER